MTYVVDTHVLVWYFEGGRKLGRRALAILNDQSAKLIIPSIVVAELRYLASKERLYWEYGELLRKIERDPRMELYPLDIGIVNAMPTNLEMHDAIICATALVYSQRLGEDVAIVTRDEEIQKLGILETVW